VVMLGGIAAEFFTDHRKLKTSIPELIDTLQGKSPEEMEKAISRAQILRRQKSALIYLIKRTSYPDNTREALARQLIADEEARCRKVTKITDIVARVAPMFGLMGTLIPLGPGLIALGQGDTKTLSDSLMIAFDTTIAGLVSGAVSYFISGVRKGWYEQYMSWTQTIMETILNVQSAERKKAYRKLQKQKEQQNAGKTGSAPASASVEGFQPAVETAAPAKTNPGRYL